MPRILERALSPTFVKTAPPGMHCDGRGLYLQVTVGKDGKLNRSWIFRYRVNGRSRDLGLGPLATIGLSEARERAKARRQARPAVEQHARGLRLPCVRGAPGPGDRHRPGSQSARADLDGEARDGEPA